MRFDRAGYHGPAAASLLVLSVLASAIFAGTAPVGAEENTNPLGSMLGLFAGHVDLDQDTIDYRPRAPLVVPPTRDLPEPKATVHDPAWPKDADANAQRRAAIDSRRRAPQSSSKAGTETPAKESQSGPVEPAKSEQVGDCSILAAGSSNCLFGTWNNLQSAFGGGASSDAVKPGAEPQRKLLIEPPPGYRTATVSPKPAEDKPKPKAESEPASGFSTFLRGLGLGKSADSN